MAIKIIQNENISILNNQRFDIYNLFVHNYQYQFLKLFLFYQNITLGQKLVLENIVKSTVFTIVVKTYPTMFTFLFNLENF